MRASRSACPFPKRKLGGGAPVSPLAHVRVRDPETGELLGPGQPGALEMAGPSLMVGYYGNEQATASAMTADGYVRTGDLGQLDGRGGFTFLSRMGDVLRLSGFLVNPLEIEMHIQKVPGISGCQTVAVPRPEGVRAIAFVTLEPGAVLDEAATIVILQARARQLQGADAHLPDRRLPQDPVAQRLQDPARQAARDGGGASALLAGSAPLRGAHGLCDRQRCATEWRAPSKDLKELLAGDRGAQRQRLELRPGDVAVDAAAQAAVGRGDDPLAPDQLGEAADTLGDQLGVLDDVGGVADDTGQDELVVGQLTSCHTRHSCSCRTLPASNE